MIAGARDFEAMQTQRECLDELAAVVEAAGGTAVVSDKIRVEHPDVVITRSAKSQHWVYTTRTEENE